jgi:hypothetical protein
VREAMSKMDELLFREEMLWLQRSRITWLKEGDRNTKFFHRKVKWRAMKNRIKKLKKEDGQLEEEEKEMQKMAVEYFKNLYMNDPNLNPSGVIDLDESAISELTNMSLCKPFTDDEIGDALFQIGPLKAPGPDGFPTRFYQRNWDVLKSDVTVAVKQFFESGIMPSGVNDTAIVLIPKGSHPEELKYFRPISLCNVIYKVVSKCLVNNLRPILDDLISPNQSAFIPGRLITDNALIAFECIHNLQQVKRQDSHFCAYKLDLTKAYDRVDWNYLQCIMLKMV